MEKRVVIIGGGFSGVHLAKQLKNKKGYQVTLVDKNNYNFFHPLLYQVSTGFLDVSDISIPFRTLFQKAKNIRFRMGNLQKVFPEDNKVQLSNGELKYDILVMAAGTKSNFFGMGNIENKALPMKTINDAVTIRNYLLQKAEEATHTKDRDKTARMKNIVISGAGPTGVEVAGMLAEMRKNIFANIYPELAREKFEIYLVDGAPEVLPPMREKSHHYSYEALKKLGIRVKLEKMVSDFKKNTVYFKDGETIPTETLIWTAGVTPVLFEGFSKENYGKGKRLLVDEYNKIQGFDDIYAIGDACLQKTDEKFSEGHPQLASVAMQQGKNVGKNLIRIAQGKSPEPFHYRDRGSMAIIGRGKAVADLTTPNKTFTGWLAWQMWLFVHLLQLMTYRNRLRTLWGWAAAYFNADQSLGMIVRPSYKLEHSQKRK